MAKSSHIQNKIFKKMKKKKGDVNFAELPSARNISGLVVLHSEQRPLWVIVHSNTLVSLK